MNNSIKIEVNTKTIIYVALSLFFGWALWTVKDLLFSLFIAFIMMSVMKPIVSFFEGKKIPRHITTIALLISTLILLGLLFSWILPMFVSETALLVKNLPEILQSLPPEVSTYLEEGGAVNYFPNIPSQALTFAQGIFSNILFFVMTLFFSAYLTIEEGIVKNLLAKFVGEKRANNISGLFIQAEKRMGMWFVGELMLMVIVGTTIYLGLLLLGVNYPIPLALIAGMLEVVPNIGPIVSTIPAFIVGFGESPLLGYSVLALYFLVQQFENNLIVPLVMKKAVGLNPIVSLIVLYVGGRFGGVLGVLLSIPFTLFIETIVIGLINQEKTTKR